jgi:hypothetical protein
MQNAKFIKFLGAGGGVIEQKERNVFTTLRSPYIQNRQ